MTRYFYKETGMYIDWEQLKNLPDIDTFIDVGVGADGTPDLYQKFQEKKLVLIDPLDEAEKFYKENMQEVDAIFYKTALGESTGSLKINIEENIGRSTILDVSDINFEGNPVEQREISVNTLDDVLKNDQLGKIGIKIDTEGHEVQVLKSIGSYMKKNISYILIEFHNSDIFLDYDALQIHKHLKKNNFVLKGAFKFPFTTWEDRIYQNKNYKK